MFDLENFTIELLYNCLNVYTLKATCECINENKKVSECIHYVAFAITFVSIGIFDYFCFNFASLLPLILQFLLLVFQPLIFILFHLPHQHLLLVQLFL
jgi:hypothetical protein